jgi:hypothetical protein
MGPYGIHAAHRRGRGDDFAKATDRRGFVTGLSPPAAAFPPDSKVPELPPSAFTNVIIACLMYASLLTRVNAGRADGVKFIKPAARKSVIRK